MTEGTTTVVAPKGRAYECREPFTTGLTYRGTDVRTSASGSTQIWQIFVDDDYLRSGGEEGFLHFMHNDDFMSLFEGQDVYFHCGRVFGYWAPVLSESGEPTSFRLVMSEN